MKILVYTITYNRLNLTREYLRSLKEHTHIKFDHIIFDNGSTDRTVEYLRAFNYKVISFGENLGITEAQNRGLRTIYKDYDFIIKFDNDCEVVSDFILEKILNFYDCEEKNKYILSPIDLALDPLYKPQVLGYEGNIELTTHNGGMFRVVPNIAMDYMITKDIRMDVNEGRVWRDGGFKVGYFKDLEVIHRGLNLGSSDYKL